MNWIAFVILSYVTVALQSALTPMLRYGSSSRIWDDHAGIIALYADRQSALLGCFILGAMQDLATCQRLGCLRLAMDCGTGRYLGARSVYREHPLTHFSCALLAGFVTTVVLYLHARFHTAETRLRRFPASSTQRFWRRSSSGRWISSSRSSPSKITRTLSHCSSDG